MRFEKPKGQRLRRYFSHITVNNSLWYYPNYKKWLSYNCSDIYCQSYVICRTLKAFKRHLKKHPEIKGNAVLRSRYFGYDIFG